MESVASSQTLDSFIQFSPVTCEISTTGLEALALLQNGCSYIVVLNHRGQPQGLFTSQCVLGWLNLEEIPSEREIWRDYARRTLADLDLQPLPAIATSTTVTEFLARISQYQYAASTWALVDRANKYLGIIEVLPLIRQLIWQNANASTHSLTQITHVIEQLPLPLMIRKVDGEVLGTNQAWRNSIGRIEPLIDLPALSAGQAKRYQYQDAQGEVHTWQVIHVELVGNLQGLEIAIAQNVTAQEQLAAELSGQNANLMRLNRLKDEFLACISHELKTPLTSVIGMASLLNNKAIGELNARQSRYVSMIHQSGRHLTEVIDNIVDLAKAETGQLELELETLELKQICEQSIQQARKLVQQDTWIYQTNLTAPELSELEVHLDIDPKLIIIVADASRLQQMLVNLLSNAIKFTEAAEKQQVGLTVHQWEGWIAFTVWDKGIGISEDKQYLIFQKFQQLESTLTRRFEGTGLGLVLTRHLARLHGGDVTFISQVNVGSEFTVLLPPEPPEPVEIDTLQVSATSDRLVLIVEAVARDITRLMNTLTAWGYRVVVARMGTEALEKARRLQPCLIVLSPDLPMLSGWDVLALLKQDADTRHISVVMAIELSDQVNEQEQVANQADGFLIKPVQPADLSAFLPRYLLNKSPLRLLCLEQSLAENLTEALQKAGHHLIEAADIEQGVTLAKIWHPNLILLNTEPENLPNCLERLSNADVLMKLPVLVIGEIPSPLRQKFTQLKLHSYISDHNHPITALGFHKVLKRAIGHLRSPTVVIFNFAGAEVLTQSLNQYLSLAGFHTHLLQNSELLVTQMQAETIDAVLITLSSDHDWQQQHLSTEIQETVSNLKSLLPCPPIIIIDGRTEDEPSAHAEVIDQLVKIATVVLKQPDAIANLLPTLRRCLALQ